MQVLSDLSFFSLFLVSGKRTVALQRRKYPFMILLPLQGDLSVCVDSPSEDIRYLMIILCIFLLPSAFRTTMYTPFSRALRLWTLPWMSWPPTE